MEIITCQHEWVRQCQIRYRTEPPVGFHFEDAHYPIPESQNGTETVRLWYPDHVIQGVLQTLELNLPCMHGFRVHVERDIVKNVYPDYLELFEKAYKVCQGYACRKMNHMRTPEQYQDVIRKSLKTLGKNGLKARALKRVDNMSQDQRKKICEERAKTLGSSGLKVASKKANNHIRKKVEIKFQNGEILYFDSLRQAEREINVKRDTIRKYADSGKTYRGMTFVVNDSLSKRTGIKVLYSDGQIKIYRSKRQLCSENRIGHGTVLTYIESGEEFRGMRFEALYDEPTP